ncbi:MAG TPA: hypothetical protein VFJ22_03035 [Dermatophilaceae bacterium]|jgi:hypothetical protein|nr:hypothetical protein [Dermatophilaceae bacterium]
MSTAHVTEIHTYPVKGEPGTDLSEVDVEEGGLAGDRRKKAPVHLISREQSEGVRANFVVDLSPEDLRALAGSVVSLGAARLGIVGPAGTCAGVYADVEAPGHVRVGDALE